MRISQRPRCGSGSKGNIKFQMRRRFGFLGLNGAGLFERPTDVLLQAHAISRGAFRAGLPGGSSLVLDPAGSRNRYPSSRSRNGSRLRCRSRPLRRRRRVRVPVLRTELETIFPSAASLAGSGEGPSRVTVAYEMSLVGRVGAPGLRRTGKLPLPQMGLARLHRGYPFLRTALATVSAVLTRSNITLGFREDERD